eukprot:GILJ01016941.1.p1 GENE.GILJ01016941.1~~GILJ01016941.1.p1  ORF type:complete len:489 (+),score=60.95 GILJ01016941.1:235-1701(+)
MDNAALLPNPHPQSTAVRNDVKPQDCPILPELKAVVAVPELLQVVAVPPVEYVPFYTFSADGYTVSIFKDVKTDRIGPSVTIENSAQKPNTIDCVEARLVGTNIVHLNVSYEAGNGTYLVELARYDSGVYLLDLRIVCKNIPNTMVPYRYQVDEDPQIVTGHGGEKAALLLTDSIFLPLINTDRPAEPDHHCHPFNDSMLTGTWKPAKRNQAIDDLVIDIPDAYTWVPNRCKLRMYTKSAASACFANRYVLFAGDSNTRDLVSEVLDVTGIQPGGVGQAERHGNASFLGRHNSRISWHWQETVLSIRDMLKQKLSSQDVKELPDVVVFGYTAWSITAFDDNLKDVLNITNEIIDLAKAKYAKNIQFVFQGPQARRRRHQSSDRHLYFNRLVAWNTVLTALYQQHEVGVLDQFHVSVNREELYDGYHFGFTYPEGNRFLERTLVNILLNYMCPDMAGDAIARPHQRGETTVLQVPERRFPKTIVYEVIG